MSEESPKRPWISYGDSRLHTAYNFVDLFLQVGDVFYANLQSGDDPDPDPEIIAALAARVRELWVCATLAGAPEGVVDTIVEIEKSLKNEHLMSHAVSEYDERFSSGFRFAQSLFQAQKTSFINAVGQRFAELRGEHVEAVRFLESVDTLHLFDTEKGSSQSFNLSRMESRILEVLSAAVRPLVIAEIVAASDDAFSIATAKKALPHLQERRLVHRPDGPNSGWVATSAGRAAIRSTPAK